MKNISKIIISALTVVTLVSVCTACKDNKSQTGTTQTSITQSSAESSTDSSVLSDIQSSEKASSEGMSSKEIDDMSEVDDRLKNLMQSEDFKAASEQNKLEAVETLLNELAKEDLIIGESINYDVRNSQFSFQYKSGALGGVMMKPFAEDMN